MVSIGLCAGGGGDFFLAAAASLWVWKPLLPFPSTLSDYQTLRIGGLVFAVVFFTVGILLILSK